MRFPAGVALTAPCAPLSTLKLAARSPSWGSPTLTPDRRKRLPHHRLHPVGTAPEGVPSSLFTFRPSPRALPKELCGGEYESDDDGDGDDNIGDDVGNLPGALLQGGLIESSDLPGVSALLVEVRGKKGLAITIATGWGRCWQSRCLFQRLCVGVMRDCKELGKNPPVYAPAFVLQLYCIQILGLDL